MVYTPSKPRLPGKPPSKQKVSPEDWQITGLDLRPGDIPTRENKDFSKLHPSLLAPDFTEPGASQPDRFRTNVAVMLRAFDYFFDLREIEDFWDRLKRTVCQHFSTYAMELVAERYLAARQRYLEKNSINPEVGQGLELVITNLADKIMSKKRYGLRKHSHLHESFSERSESWARAVKRLDRLFGPLKEPPTKAYLASISGFKRPESPSSLMKQSPKDKSPFSETTYASTQT
ncbi:hypothetical protein Micbo1qcDRAFT_195597 [Microdochium bolleyi]|uniref:Uncharacterized protein n=1 Tax=Microdochium bolleyi TaxID=196109 RepID=A0A136J2R0_9PEZI|nr:hypothetical protein Micbo1qcDRAFT_195597 [Microdochium bolleyi]